MATLSFSEIYNLFRLEEMRAIIEECLARLGMPEINSLPSDKVLVLNSSTEELAIRVTMKEEIIGGEERSYFPGRARVRIEVAASSDDDKALAKSIDVFRYCVLIRATRGGG